MAIFIAWMNVEGEGLKHVAWRNWDNYFLVFFIWTNSLSACDGLLGGVSGMNHRSSDFFHLPVRIRFLFLSNT